MTLFSECIKACGLDVRQAAEYLEMTEADVTRLIEIGGAEEQATDKLAALWARMRAMKPAIQPEDFSGIKELFDLDSIRTSELPSSAMRRAEAIYLLETIAQDYGLGEEDEDLIFHE